MKLKFFIIIFLLSFLNFVVCKSDSDASSVEIEQKESVKLIDGNQIRTAVLDSTLEKVLHKFIQYVNCKKCFNMLIINKGNYLENSKSIITIISGSYDRFAESELDNCWKTTFPFKYDQALLIDKVYFFMHSGREDYAILEENKVKNFTKKHSYKFSSMCALIIWQINFKWNGDIDIAKNVNEPIYNLSYGIFGAPIKLPSVPPPPPL